MKYSVVTIATILLSCFLTQSRASEYRIKTYYTGSSHYGNAYNFDETNSFSDQERAFVLNDANFGAGGTVSDVAFISITSISSLTPANFVDAEILIVTAPGSPSHIITTTEAGYLRDFVNSGGSLIYFGDYDTGSITCSNNIGAAFGGITFGSGYSGGTFIITDYSTTLTDGAFGYVENWTYGSNATSSIASLGTQATSIATVGGLDMIAKIDSNGTSGSAVFFTDPYLSVLTNGNLSSEEGQFFANLFQYSAQSVGGSAPVVPEPATCILLGVGVSGVVRRLRK